MHRYHVSISNVSRLISHVSISLRGFPPSLPFVFSSCSAIPVIVCRRLRLLAAIFVRWNINYYLGERLGAPSGHRQTTSTSILSCEPSFVQWETVRDRERGGKKRNSSHGGFISARRLIVRSGKEKGDGGPFASPKNTDEPWDSELDRGCIHVDGHSARLVSRPWRELLFAACIVFIIRAVLYFGACSANVTI